MELERHTLLNCVQTLFRSRSLIDSYLCNEASYQKLVPVSNSKVELMIKLKDVISISSTRTIKIIKFWRDCIQESSDDVKLMLSYIRDHKSRQHLRGLSQLA